MTTEMITIDRDYYLDERKLPHSWCPGCGYGIAVGSICRAIASKNYKQEDLMIATGIGCWGKSDDILSTDGLHTTHGRAIAFATGVAINKPNLKVLTLVGDGDGATIGGNHLIHAARRNVNMTVIMANNLLYGQTGGQYSATTPYGSITQTSQFGNVETDMDMCKFVEAAGANFVGRETVLNPVKLDNLIKRALDVKGFSFVEILSGCPAHYGKMNKYYSNVELMDWLGEIALPLAKYEKLDEEKKEKYFPTGVLCEKFRDDYLTSYEKRRAEAKAMMEERDVK